MSNITPVVYAALGINLNVTSQEEALKQFQAISAYMEILEDAKQQLRTKMFEMADAEGEKDERGSAFVVLPNGFGWKKEIRRPTPVVNYEGALELFKRKNLTHRITVVKDIAEDKKDRAISILENTAPDFIVRKESIADSDIETAFLQGEITDSELKSVVDTGEAVYALKMVKPK